MLTRWVLAKSCFEDSMADGHFGREKDVSVMTDHGASASTSIRTLFPWPLPKRR